MSFIDVLEKNLIDEEESASDHYNDFKEFALKEFSYAETTAHQYAEKANIICRELLNEYGVELEDIEPGVVRSLFDMYAKKHEYTKSTMQHYRRTVHFLGAYLKNEALEEFTYRLTNFDDRILSKEDVENIILSEDMLKYKVAYALGYFSFFRTSDILNLRFEDISFKKKLIYISSLDKVLELNDVCFFLLGKLYLESKKPEDYLMIGRGGKRLSERSLQVRCNNLTEEVIGYPLSYGILRKSGVLNKLVETDLEKMHELTGMTKKYLQILAKRAGISIKNSLMIGEYKDEICTRVERHN